MGGLTAEQVAEGARAFGQLGATMKEAAEAMTNFGTHMQRVAHVRGRAAEVGAWFVGKLAEAAAHPEHYVDIDFASTIGFSAAQMEQVQRMIDGGVKSGTFKSEHIAGDMTTRLHLTPEGIEAFSRREERRRIEDISKEGVFSDRRAIQLEDDD